MARVPIEIIVVGEKGLTDVPAAIALANSEQNEFLFSYAPDDLGRQIQMQTFELNEANELLDSIEGVRTEMRGYFPFLIMAMDSKLDGKMLENLFGSCRAKRGIAVITTSLVPDIVIPTGRMVAYFIYYFARYSLSFMSPSHYSHNESHSRCDFE